MTPRGSIASVMSAGLQNFVYNAEYESDEEKDEDDEVSYTIKDENKWTAVHLVLLIITMEYFIYSRWSHLAIGKF